MMPPQPPSPSVRSSPRHLPTHGRAASRSIALEGAKSTAQQATSLLDPERLEHLDLSIPPTAGKHR